MLEDADVTDGFVLGESQVTPQGRVVAQERKSPPLAALTPERDRYLRVPPDRHIRPEYVDLEWNKLWTKIWLCAGRVSDLPSKGAWFRFDFGRESFIVSRSDDDRITAFYNVCQHRANRLVDDDFGKTSAFICPYHSWRFDRAGRCTHVTDRDTFKAESLAGELDIPTVRCETFGGFVFINMDAQAMSLADYLGEVTDIVSGYRTDRMEVRAEVDLALACNWKVILDAFSESYHVHITHPGAGPISEDKHAQMDFYGHGHSRRIIPIGNPAERWGKRDGLNQLQKGLLASLGIDPESFAGGAQDVRRAVQVAKRAMGGAYGEAYATLSDNQLTDDWAMNLFPNMHWSMHAEGVLVMWYNPHPTDPAQCTLRIMILAHPGIPFDFYLPESTEFEASGRPVRKRVRHDDPDVREMIGQLLFEDIRNTREAQKGLGSRGFRQIRLSEQEQSIMCQYAEMDRYFARE